MSVAQGLLLYCNRIVVPCAIRQQIIGKLHNGHMGVSKCRSRAEQPVWWPGISSEIKALVASCSFCQEYRPSQRHEPMISTPLPDGLWLPIGADLLTYEGNNYIVIADYYSRWKELIYMGRNTTAKSAVNKFKNVFSHWGIPQKCTTDNGPQFSSNELKQFAELYGFVSTTSNPRYPQSNGAAEKSVDIAKHILAQDNPMEALMEYRATPTASTGFSPTKLMMGWNIHTRLLTTDRHLKPEWPSHVHAHMSDEAHKNRNKHYYDLRRGVRHLPELHPGDTVRVKDKKNGMKLLQWKVLRAPQGLTRYKPLAVCSVVTVVICHNPVIGMASTPSSGQLTYHFVIMQQDRIWFQVYIYVHIYPAKCLRSYNVSLLGWTTCLPSRV